MRNSRRKVAEETVSKRRKDNKDNRRGVTCVQCGTGFERQLAVDLSSFDKKEGAQSGDVKIRVPLGHFDLRCDRSACSHFEAQSMGRAAGKVIYAYFCKPACLALARLPEISEEVLNAAVADLRAREEVTRVRALNGCTRQQAIAWADISEEHKQIFLNAPPCKKLTSPQMLQDPICQTWISLTQAARDLREAIFIAVTVVLCGSADSVEVLRLGGLLTLDAADSGWAERFEKVSKTVDDFWHTVTRQSGSYANKEDKLQGMCKFRQGLLSATLDEHLRGKQLRIRVEEMTPKELLFGPLKAYIWLAGCLAMPGLVCTRLHRHHCSFI